jgi:hypothetical protein
MPAMHRGLGITAAQRLRFVTLLSAAADTAGRRAAPARTGPAVGLGVAPPYQP